MKLVPGITVLVIDARSSFKRQVEKRIAAHGYRVYSAESTADLLKKIESAGASLVVLYYTPPVEPILELVRMCKKNPRLKDVLVLFYSDILTSSTQVVTALEAGVDDYIVCPFNWKVFSARVKALARRAAFHRESQQWLTGKNIKVNLSSHIVKVDSKSIELRPKEYGLLCLFLEKQGAVLDRSFLMEQIWEYAYFGTTRTVDKHVENLRNKLGRAGKHIRTIERVGYKFE